MLRLLSGARQRSACVNEIGFVPCPGFLDHILMLWQSLEHGTLQKIERRKKNHHPHRL